MNSFIESLNQWGGNFLSFAWPMLWQSSLLIAVLFGFDLLFRHKLRASIRYVLWLVVLVKICVPPTLALPTSPAWWLHQTPPPVADKPMPHYTVTYTDAPLAEIPSAPLPAFVPPKPKPTNAAWLLLASASASSVLLGWLLVRWWQITRQVRRAETSERLTALAAEAQTSLGMKFKVQVRLTTNSMSPAVCGLFRPTILIPQSLADNFSDGQLRAVLLHELIHLRRRDVWVNFLQALLQIFYWWHPLVWLANARIRRVREEAVDDAVMLALRDEAETYAPTLLEVAKLALNRPLASLGLVGIMESRHALRQRIERLMDFRAPRHAGLTLVSLLGILAFTAVAVPMGEGPSPVQKETLPAPVSTPAIVAQNTNADATNVTSILSDPDYRVVQKAREQRSGSETLNEPEVVTTNLFTRTFKVDLATLRAGLESFRKPYIGSQINPAANMDALSPDEMAREFFAMLRINLQPPSGKSVIYNDQLGALVVTATKIDLDNIERVIEGLNYMLSQSSIPSLPASTGIVSATNTVQLLGSNIPSNNSGRQKSTLEKLVTIRLDQFGPFEGVRLGEAVRGLLKTSGIGDEESAETVPVVINLPLPLQNISLIDGLDAIVAHASKLIKYTIMDDMIVFSVFDSPPSELYSQNFKVVQNLFPASLRRQTGMKTNDVPTMARKFFSTLGVDWESPKGKTVFYGDRLGRLFVRATMQDLHTIEQALPALNRVPPMIHIKARFIELTQDDSKASGFDWYLGNFGSNNVTGKVGSSSSPTAPVSAANPIGNFPGSMTSNPVGLSNSTSAAGASVTGILTDTNYRVVLHALSSRSKPEILGEPEITTLSGRRTILKQTTIISVITNFTYEETATNSGVSPQTENLEVGPILDSIASVLSDGYTIDLNLKASYSEFLGYDKPTHATTAAYTKAGVKIDVPNILPRIETRQASAHMNVRDGQTVVLGGMIIPSIQTTKEKVPILGSLPGVGRLFQSQSKTKVLKNLMVFVTATIVDPAGNRIHSDAEMPFATQGVPPQPPQPK